MAKDAGADLVVTNQTDPAQVSALQQAGWFPYRSNYVVAFSRTLAARIGAAPVYVTRGDGDGLLNL
jgi:hypothetical protein